MALGLPTCSLKGLMRKHTYMYSCICYYVYVYLPALVLVLLWAVDVNIRSVLCAIIKFRRWSENIHFPWHAWALYWRCPFEGHCCNSGNPSPFLSLLHVRLFIFVSFFRLFMAAAFVLIVVTSVVNIYIYAHICTKYAYMSIFIYSLVHLYIYEHSDAKMQRKCKTVIFFHLFSGWFFFFWSQLPCFCICFWL